MALNLNLGLILGLSYNGSMRVSKTLHPGSSPGSPANIFKYFFLIIYDPNTSKTSQRKRDNTQT